MGVGKKTVIRVEELKKAGETKEIVNPGRGHILSNGAWVQAGSNQ